MYSEHESVMLIEPAVRYVSYLYKLNTEYSTEEFYRLGLSELYDISIEDKFYFEDALRLSLKYNTNSLTYLLESSAYCSFLIGICDIAYGRFLLEVLNLSSHSELILFFRAFYRYGNPIISDSHYDLLEKVYREFNNNELNIILNRSYDDDSYSEILQGILNLSGISTVEPTPYYVSEEEKQEREKYSKDLITSKSTSIRPVTECSELWNFITKSKSNIQFSLKIDGVNCKAVFDNNELKVAYSRGRGEHSKPFDYTDALLRALPEIKLSEQLDTITGEVYVTEETLNKLRIKYPNRTFKTPKSTAQSMMRAPHKYTADDMKGIRWLTFYSEKSGATADIMFNYLTECGFECPYRILVDRLDIPNNYEDFCVWLQFNILNPMYAHSTVNSIPSDGVVCDLLEVIGNERNDHYNDNSVAIKFGEWSASIYTSTVKRLIVEQRRVYASVVAEIEPVVSRDNNIETMVNIGSLQIAIEDNIIPGKVISFMRKSEANNVYVRDRGF